MWSLTARGYFSKAPDTGKAAAPDGVVEAAHVPADGHGFFHLQLHEPLDEKDAFLAMAVRNMSSTL